MNVLDDEIEITLNNTTLKWYRSKGYIIPTVVKQLWITRDGIKQRHGTKECVANGTKITVKVSDLPPSSNQPVRFKCESCDNVYTSTLAALRNKKTSYCKSCNNTINGSKPDTHQHWVRKLITLNGNACCDICKESHSPFLELHHLLSVSNGGLNEEANYVILCANHHKAFHHSLGGTQVLCTPEDYGSYKESELSRLLPNHR